MIRLALLALLLASTAHAEPVIVARFAYPLFEGLRDTCGTNWSKPQGKLGEVRLYGRPAESDRYRLLALKSAKSKKPNQRDSLKYDLAKLPIYANRTWWDCYVTVSDAAGNFSCPAHFTWRRR